MVDGKLINKYISESGKTVEHLSNKLNISRQSFYYKLNGRNEFTVSEMFILADELNIPIDKCKSIFFGVNSD